MARLIILAFAILTTFAPLALAYQTPQNSRADYNFNADWRLNVGDAPNAQATAFDDSGWQTVATPHAWNEDSAFKVGIDDLPTGIAWYRKHFRLPANSAGKKIFLEFEGIRHGGEFYLNGQSIGRSENGVMAFGFDISDKIKSGENVLAAKIDNAWDYREKANNQRYQWNDKNFYANYGGINKNVKLHITDPLHQTLPLYSNLGTTGVAVYAQDFNIAGKSATVNAESQVVNEYGEAKAFDYQVVIEDRDGKVVKTFDGGQTTIDAGQTETVKASARVENLNFWSWGYGYLYNVYTILRVNNVPVDVVKTRTGFRKLEFENGAIKLNDRTIQVKGYAQRTTNEWPALGTDVPPWMSDFSNRLMVQGNANLVRWMHVTPSKQDVESCDRVGLMQAMPAGDSEADVTGNRWDQRVQLMRDAIIYNRNNPSVVFYESGNNGISEAHMSEMKAIRDQYDPHGGRAFGSRNMQGSAEAEYGGEMLYINKSAGKPMWAMEYSRDEGLRKYWDEWSPPFHPEGDGPQYKNEPAPSYNHNQDQHAIENVRRWVDYWRERPGTGKRVNAGGVNIIFSDSNTHHRGESNYRTSGEVDAMRLPKDGFFANQVVWDGWVNIEHPRAYILGHWNYAAGVKKPVYVVSSADRVELFVNGKSLGFGKRDDNFLFTFPDVQWQAGTLRAVGMDASGQQICEDSRVTVGAPASLRLTPITGPNGLRADGADVALFDVEVVDAAGKRCPTALNLVNFALRGPAQWRGGIAQGPSNHILSKILPVENGVNRVAIRSMPQAGKIVLTATADGLKSANIEIESKTAPATDGISAISTDLPSFLERGPTPLGESFQMSRQPLVIARVKAGANAETAAQSYDDNEATSWSNDNNRNSGWIQYQLAQPATVSEITLKMGGWRTKSYPIRISVDGKEVWKGNTPQSLGYVTLAVKPTKGQRVGIELIGSTVNRDEFGSIVELENAANAATAGQNSNAKGELNIVEAEIYGDMEKISAAPSAFNAPTTGTQIAKKLNLMNTTEKSLSSGGWLFATFKGEATPLTEQIYFASSRDGQNWSALNGAKPVLVSKLGERGVRDPFLLRAPDGKKFFLLATDLSINLNPDWKRAVRTGSQSLVIWESPDLVHWSEPRLVRVAASGAGCAWAPEAIYDEKTGDYLVFWASTNADDDFSKHRIWAARTRDFQSFGAPFIYIEGEKPIIDTDIVRDGDFYYRFNKDEKRSTITMERSRDLGGEWKPVETFSLANLVGYEGPQCFPLGDGRWCLLLDYFAKGEGYKAFLTDDLASGKFEAAPDFAFPFRLRHGSVLAVSAEEMARLQNAFGSSRNVEASEAATAPQARK